MPPDMAAQRKWELRTYLVPLASQTSSPLNIVPTAPTISQRTAPWLRRLVPSGGLWRHGDFLKLWTGQSLSVFGSMVGGTALDFTAILFLGATPLQKAFLFAAARVPAFLAGLLAGVLVDRLPRRSILIVTDLGRALVLGSIPAAAVLGVLRIEQLYVVAFVNSILTLLFDLAYQSYLPVLVRRDQLLEGNSRLSATASVAEVSGFGIAGWLVQWLTAPLTILIDAVSFVISAAFFGLIRTREPSYRELRAASGPAGEPDDAARTGAPVEQVSVWRDGAEGLRVVWRHPILRALLIAVVLGDLGGGIVGTLIVLYMVREVAFDPGVLGMIWAVGGVTSFLGAVIAGPLTRRLGIGPAMVFSLVFAGIGTLLTPLAYGASLLSAVLLIGNQLVSDPAATVYNINEVSLRQRIVPDHLLGRVSATLRMAGLGMALVGAFAGGVLGEVIGIRAALVAGACVNFLAAGYLALSPVMRLRQIAAGESA
jgi:MFS family permease